MLKALTFVLAVLCFGCHVGHSHEIATEMATAAEHLMKSLDDSQRASIQFDMKDPLREGWQFIPMERKGLGFKSMKPHQRGLAMVLVQTTLSHQGFATAMQIMALEDVLRQLENNPVKRDPEKYHLFVFGQPGTKQSWGWRVEGHHLSLSVTIAQAEEGQSVSISPGFFGTNPAEVRTGSMAGTRVLGPIEDAGRKLAKNLSVEQKQTAILDVKVPRDVILGPGKDAVNLSPAGISLAQLSKPQAAMLMDLIERYLKQFRQELATPQLKKIREADPKQVRFAWIGKLKPGQPHYFRVQGPTFVMEYDNTQNKANHAHLVWRDLENDFGNNALKEHYQRQHGAKVKSD